MYRYTTEAKIRILRREVYFRKKVYAGRVEAGTMTAEEARHETEGMEAILNDYQRGLPRTGDLFNQRRENDDADTKDDTDAA